ncbi:L-seryl-tRNA(Ser) seleniumtransferase [Desulfohalotomaculum tongense]|uniref:L-seryl-tRNA(Sec) selenium transferase n=1 Tax=Desulforadius tongensis TaxID=1216062 RepID=UPI00195D9AF7|nr:L-seryl-tRNA(Sec) selenium transferase [Desulforadius tongensis]MBM7855900.1 L-seryl-tRNA(Ser) seleniumtransferase [Desulforadius tongensis]
MAGSEQIALLRELPAVDEMLRQPKINDLLLNHSRTEIVEAVRKVLDEMRAGILSGKIPAVDMEGIVDNVLHTVKQSAGPNLRAVINATGVILHTNLGRALLSDRARQAVARVSEGYCNLEIDLNTGKRGSRYSALEGLLTKLTGAEDALVVNNNASAVLLALGTLARGKEVIVSRGQLVEIGGSFRIPEVMAQSGARLVEVGTTNKTYPRDYEAAITEETGLLLNVHTSNYRIVGFTRETTVEELVQLGGRYSLPVMSDLGSGFLVDLSPYGLPQEPTVQETVKAGADVVTFSGDKLLGGPQAGIIVGKKHFIDKMKKNPLTRAVRIDKFTVAALEATLREYLHPDRVLQNVPTLRMLTEPLTSLHQKARQLAEIIAGKVGDMAEVAFEEGVSRVGGGAMPTADLPTGLVRVTPRNIPVERLVTSLRLGEPAVVGRVQEGSLLLDVRTLQKNDTEPLVQALLQALQSQ